MSAPRILAFAGSSRRASCNRQLARLASQLLTEQGGSVTLIELRDYPMPLYDGDLEAEQGLPEATRQLQALLASHQGLLVVSPEYNGFMTPLLKNTLDWLSRPNGDTSGLDLFRDRLGLVLSASPGALGGLNSLRHTRELLGRLGVMLMPDQLAVGQAMHAFDADGHLLDPALQARLQEQCLRFVQTLNTLQPLPERR